MSCNTGCGCSSHEYHNPTNLNKDQVRTTIFSTNQASALLMKDSYQLAKLSGFSGSLNEWLSSLHGRDGKDAYQLALEDGFVGTMSEWLSSIIGPQGIEGKVGKDGKSAYEIAKDNGFLGTEKDWISSLYGTNTDVVFRSSGIWNKVEW